MSGGPGLDAREATAALRAGFIGWTDLSLDALGWTLIDGDDGPAYVFGASPAGD
jgi:hypothetical protein